ncbi:putative helicase mov-10-B.1 [Chelonus insularis]|uniref:putative helicase mov-10-B.1 n=1 Tax=Chelonus insularis TaxID=460826 RepID=UPI00158F5AF8|nr:putative helicase mov-10-B.1 [Chelonus insularis]XP_034939298.1 putative helicase mov-10-B.1 [Chelonus insularis]
MSNHLIPDVIKNVIEDRSKKDCISNAPNFYMNPAFIPGVLRIALDHYGKATNEVPPPAQDYHTILSGLSNFKEWTPEIYWYLWKLLLYIEYSQSIEDMKQYSLKNQTISESKYQAGSFIIPVKNLSEDRPSIKENDKIDLLQVNGKNHCVGTVSWVGKDYVVVEATAAFANKFTTDQIFNVEFRCDTRTLTCLNYALNKVYQNRMVSMFFPQKNVDITESKDIDINWINKNIETNPEQMQAVKNILKKTSHPAPYIVFGPPGTGKTSTLVETICQIMIRNPSNRILICTSSNSAADEIVERLINQFSSVDDTIFRMYGASRKSTEIKLQLKTVSNFADTTTISLAEEVFLTKKIVVTTLMTCTRLHAYKLRADHFSYLFIDEAGQASEIETLIPFVLMSSMDTNNQCRISGQVVIAGDPKQLGPFCQSTLAEPLLSRSMLERLMECGPYLRNENNQKYDSLYVTKLVQNYRCHHSILHVPNILFYDGELIAKSGKRTTKALNWSKLPRKGFPIIFHAIRGKESRIKDSPSVCNHAEVNIVIEYINELRNSKHGEISVNLNDIGVVTPYRLQRTMIHQALQNKNLEEISVGTVEAFQGKEKDVIIISTVRTCVYTRDNEYFIGFLSHPKRFNVALTRAKSLLIVIGHPDVLQQDHNWRTFIEYCFDNKACKGEQFTLNPSVHDLQIRQFGRSFRKNKYNYERYNNDQDQYSVIEDENSCLNREDTFNKNRRRRLPIGPLPKEIIDSENAIKMFLRDWQNNELHKKEYSNWADFDVWSDQSQDSTDEDEKHDDDDDESWESDSSLEVDNFSDNYFKNLLIDEKEFESELNTRMAKLKLG